MQFLIGSLNWLSISTRPDISTTVSLLAKFTHRPSQGHIDAAIRLVKYLKGTKNRGITFPTKATISSAHTLTFPLLMTLQQHLRMPIGVRRIKA